MSYEYDVFVSYSSRDLDRVVNAASWLRDHGLRVWFDRWMIEPGEPISIKIEKALASSRILLAFLSRSALRSDWAMVERYATIFRDPASVDRRFIPIVLENGLSLPPLLANYKHVNLTIPTPAAYNELLSACLVAGPAALSRHPRLQKLVEVIVHHLDDEPELIRWIPSVLMNRLLLRQLASVDVSSFVDLKRETTFVIQTQAKPIRLRYKFHTGLASLKRGIRTTARFRQVLIADLMLPGSKGRFANDGLDALRLAGRAIPRARRFVLTAFPQAITPEVRRLVLPKLVFSKPPDVSTFIDEIIRAVALTAA